MRKLLLASALGLSLALPAFAAPPSDASLDRLFTVTQTQKLTAAMLDQVDAMLKPAFHQAIANEDLSPAQREAAQSHADEFTRRMRPILAEELGWERLKALYSDIYREAFSQEEVDGLIAFYQSPIGRVVIEKMPIVMQRTMAETQRRMGPLTEKIRRAVQETLDELKARQPAAAKP